MNVSAPTQAAGTTRPKALWVAVAAALIAFMAMQCLHTARRDSLNWDESQHLYSGWLSWKHADYGYNPEVPPLVKMWDALPLLHRDMHQPAYEGDPFKREGFVLGMRFLKSNGIDHTILAGRAMATLLTVFLGATMFLAAWEMFGVAPALFGLALFTFDPNFLAHGSYVTTDIGASLTTLLAVYGFYRFVKRPTVARMLLVGLAVGLMMSAKFTGILIVPILVLIAVAEVWRARGETTADGRATWKQIVVGLVVASAIGFVCVWAIYGFRYAARPAGMTLNPLTADYLQKLTSPLSRGAMTMMARFHLLPEAYIYGLADTKISAEEDTCYFWGRMLLHAPRLYFPAALVIKSTLPFLLLLCTAIVLAVSRRWKAGREIAFLTIPAAVLFLVASMSDIGIGYRHLLPAVTLLYVLVAGGAWALLGDYPKWRYALGFLLLWQVATGYLARPGLMAYANEAWGGPSQTHLYLSDSNTDWGQQLKATKAYLDQHPGEPCFFAYFAQGAVDYRDYGITCQELPTAAASWAGLEPMRFGAEPTLTGTLVISDGIVAGADRPGKLNPYEKFAAVTPTAVIDHGVYVYQGTFNVALAVAIGHTEAAAKLVKDKQYAQALEEAQVAVGLAPDSVDALSAEGDALAGLQRTAEATAVYAAALHAAQTVDPVFQQGTALALQQKLGGAKP